MADISAFLNKVDSSIDGNNPTTQQQLDSFKSNGFLVSGAPASDGNGLPFTKISHPVDARFKRNIITWFVPQFGTIKMYINPQNIKYSHKKLISKEKTKGGFTLQYWGEELDTINISGTTGSSGIEGINMLYEIYRSEQYAFDATGLTLAANNANADLANGIVNGLGSAIGGSNKNLAAGATGLIGGILGMDSPNSNLIPRNVPSLASLAFGIEMYYGGWVYRGYFDNMGITETTNFTLEYDMSFVVTQRRGYRTNYFPFHKNPNTGPTNYTNDFPPTYQDSFSGNVNGGNSLVPPTDISNSTSSPQITASALLGLGLKVNI